jgi:AraC-like DNA-binding protein/mannose-6-phosphate isomerase-like protein (cupin superfamily)
MKNGHLPPSTIKETPFTDYSPYRPGPITDAAQLLDRLSLQVHSIVRYQSTPNWYLHRCTVDERLFFVLNGKCRLHIADAEYAVEAGDCVHLRRGVPHSATTDPRAPLEFISLRYTAALFESLLLGDVFPLPYHFKVGLEMPFRPLLEEGSRLFALQPSGWQQNLDALGLCLVLWLLREYGTPAQLHWQSGRISDLQRLAPALRAIQAGLAHPPSVPALARLCGFSPEQFRRVFRRALGTSPALYSRRVRLEKACYLLHHTDDTIENIATRVGYRQLTSFVHAFKDLLEVAPGQYRRQSSD